MHVQLTPRTDLLICIPMASQSKVASLHHHPILIPTSFGVGSINLVAIFHKYPEHIRLLLQGINWSRLPILKWVIWGTVHLR